MSKIISIDPGNQKCGLLLADLSESMVISGKTVKRSYVIKLINLWKNHNYIDLILLGSPDALRTAFRVGARLTPPRHSGVVIGS